MKTESDVLKKFADDIADRIVRKTIVELRGIKGTLSGDDGDLKNAWEEICAQVQFESSYFWEIYDGVAWEIISRLASNLKPHEILAIWFQTDEGQEWRCTPVISKQHHDETEGDPPPACMDGVERYIQLYLYDKAENYSNKRIEKFLKRHEGI